MKNIILLSLIFLSGCADFTAVSAFSSSAPDVKKIDALSKTYVQDVSTVYKWQNIDLKNWNSNIKLDLLTDKNVTDENEKRVQTDKKLDIYHNTIVSYMKALGKLADPKLSNLSNQTKAVNTSISALKTQGVLDATEATSLTNLISALPQELLSIWVEHELGKIIRDQKNTFEETIKAESNIIDAYINDFNNTIGVIKSVNGMQHAHIQEKLNDEKTTDLEKITLNLASFDLDDTDNQQITQLLISLNDANAYKVELDRLKAAYDVLDKQEGKFTSETLKLMSTAVSAIPDIKNYINSKP